MVNEYIRYRIPAGEQEAFLAAYASAGEPLRASPYCVGYELSQCEEEPECFILQIVWTSTSDHLNQFRQSAEFRAFLPLIRRFVPNIEEMRHYVPTDVRWQGRQIQEDALKMSMLQD